MVGSMMVNTRVVHVSVLIAPERSQNRIPESFRPAICRHARPVPRVAIMTSVSVASTSTYNIVTGCRILRVQRRSCLLELVHEDVSPRGHAHRDVQRLNVPLSAFYRHVVSRPSQSPAGFHWSKKSAPRLRRRALAHHLVRAIARKPRGERHQNNGQHKTKDFMFHSP